MPRKRTTKDIDLDDNMIYDELLKIFRLTTKADRFNIAVYWCRNLAVNQKYADMGLAPIFVVLAALIDVEHPLIMAARGMMFSYTDCIVRILQTELHGRLQPIPVVHTPLCTEGGLPVYKFELSTGVEVGR